MGLLDSLSDRLGGGGDDDGGAGDADEPAGDSATADAAAPTPADFRRAAEAFAEGRDPFDVSVESLAALDDRVADGDDLVDDGTMAGDESLEGMGEGPVPWLGSYLGEVLVRAFDGEWTDDDGWVVAVPVGDGTMAVAVFDLAARSLEEEPLFAATAEEIATTVDAEPPTDVEPPTDAEPPTDVEPPTDAEASPDDEPPDAEERDEASSAGSDPTTEGASESGGETPAGGGAAPAAAAREFAAEWPGRDLDFTPESLARLDDLVDAEWDAERFRGAELDGDAEADRAFTALVHRLGSYYGEVLVRHRDGAWVDDDELGTVVELPDGDDAAVSNVYRVAADRLTGAAAFASRFDAVVDEVGGDPANGRTASTGDEAPAGPAGNGEPDEGTDTGPDDATAAEPDAGTPPIDDATAFAADYPAYDFGFTPASLTQVDALADELAGAPDAVVEGMAAYVGETFVRAYGATWTREDGRWVVEVAGAAEEPARLSLRSLAADAVDGDAAVAEFHDHVVDRLALDGPALADDATGGGMAAGTGAARGDEPPVDGPPDPPDGDPIDRFAARAAAEVAAEDADAPAPAAAVERHRDAAEELADSWPAYDLDVSVESLVRLDALVAAEFDESGGDREYEGDPLRVPEGTQLAIPTDGAVDAFGGYLAELFRRHHDATWRVDDEEPVLVVEGPNGARAVDPAVVAVACFAGESSFVDAYARVAAETGLEPPLSG